MGLERRRQGKAKEFEGKLTGDKSREAEGKLDQAKGDVKDAAGKVKDAAGNLVDRAREEIDERSGASVRAAERAPLTSCRLSSMPRSGAIGRRSARAREVTPACEV